ncbi:hypothetical protein KA005_40255 [bacterium]|nr:hypothetical protein [bacterium]
MNNKLRTWKFNRISRKYQRKEKRKLRLYRWQQIKARINYWWIRRKYRL